MRHESSKHCTSYTLSYTPPLALPALCSSFFPPPYPKSLKAQLSSTQQARPARPTKPTRTRHPSLLLLHWKTSVRLDRRRGCLLLLLRRRWFESGGVVVK